MTDPIADLLARIKNGILSRKKSVDVPTSRLKLRIAEILRDEGFLSSVEEVEESPGRKKITMMIRWDGQNRPAISGMRRASRPGQRRYVDKTEIPKVRGGLGTAILTTSRGVMTDRDARKAGVGGEVICEIW
jgi:small subunit ribosomal protein S8